MKNNPNKSKLNINNATPGCIIMLVLFTILVLWVYSCSTSPSTDEGIKNTKRTSISEYEAKAIAEGQVEILLKAPKSAEFSGLRETVIQKTELGYRVSGYVDSQNSFGVLIRSNYSCEIYLDTLSGIIMYRNLHVE